MHFFSNYTDIFFIIISFLMVYILFIFSHINGNVEKWIIEKQVKHHFDQNYTLLSDVSLFNGRDMVFIDHILISSFGIFIIETQNYSGKIFGKNVYKSWVQKEYKKTYRFPNPLLANAKKVKVVESLLKEHLDTNCIHGLIVFMPNCDFKFQMPPSVFKGKAWVNYVLSFQKEVISNSQLRHICKMIRQGMPESQWRKITKISS